MPVRAECREYRILQDDRVIHGREVQDLVDVSGETGVEIEAVIVRTTGENIATASAIETIVASTAEQRVVSRAAVQVVPAGATIELVVTALPVKPVVTAEALDRVGVGRAVEGLARCGAGDHARRGRRRFGRRWRRLGAAAVAGSIRSSLTFLLPTVVCMLVVSNAGAGERDRVGRRRQHEIIAAGAVCGRGVCCAGAAHGGQRQTAEPLAHVVEAVAILVVERHTGEEHARTRPAQNPR